MDYAVHHLKIVMIGSPAVVYFPAGGVRKPSHVYFQSEVVASSLASDKLVARKVVENITHNLKTSTLTLVQLPQYPSEDASAFTALKFVRQHVGKHIVCLAESEPSEEVKAFICEHELPCAFGKFSLSKFAGVDGIFSALRQIKFSVANSISKESLVDGELNLANGNLKIRDVSMHLSPQKVKLLSALADGEICGNDYLFNQICDPNVSLKPEKRLLDTVVCLTAGQLREEAGLENVMQRFWGVGRGLTGLDLKIIGPQVAVGDVRPEITLVEHRPT